MVQQEEGDEGSRLLCSWCPASMQLLAGGLGAGVLVRQAPQAHLEGLLQGLHGICALGPLLAKAAQGKQVSPSSKGHYVSRTQCRCCQLLSQPLPFCGVANFYASLCSSTQLPTTSLSSPAWLATFMFRCRVLLQLLSTFITAFSLMCI